MAKKIIKDNRGQWAHPGEVTQIDSNNITMKGVPFPVLGVSDKGDTQLMMPGQDYKFNGSKVTEFPIMKKGKKAQQGTVLPMQEELNSLILKNALIKERTHKRDSVRRVLTKQFPQETQYDLINQGMLKYYTQEPEVYSTLNPALLSEKKKQSILAKQKLPKSSFKSGGKAKKKAQDGEMINMPEWGSNQVSGLGNSEFYQSNTPTWGSQTVQGLGDSNIDGLDTVNTGSNQNFFNKMGGAAGVATMIGGVGNAINSPNQEEGGPTVGQKVVGQFGPWGAAISAVSQFGTKIGDEIGGTGGSIFSSMASPSAALTNKDFSTKDKVLGAINPIYAGIKNAQIKKKKKEKADKLEALVNQASSLKDPNAEKRRYVRPEDQLIDPNEMFPTYGVGTSYLKDGGNVPQMEKGGELKTYRGGGAEIISENPYLPGQGETVMFKGKSHENGGIDIKFGNNHVEVEGGEPAVKLPDGKNESLVVFGDMKIPSYGVSELNDPKAKNKKFKNYIKELSILEDKQNKIVDKNIKLINDTPIIDSFDRLKVSSGKAMVTGADMRLKQIANKKQIAANVQNAILETAEELNLDSSELAKGKLKKAKNGAKLTSAQDGGNFIIPRSKVDEYKNYGYMPDPEDVNRLYRDIQNAATTQVIPSTPPPKGGEDFNKAFGDARRKGLTEFNYKGKPYTTNLYKDQTQTITNPGSKVRDYIYIQDDPMNQTPAPASGTSPVQEVSIEQSEKERFPWMLVANSILPFIRPSNQLPLDQNQLRGEQFALANNQLEAVPAQLYNPLLESVSDISFQDQMNENQADFNTISRLTASNPAAQASLAAQKYRANSSVLGEEFRQNQTQKMNIYNRNRGVLNDATLKNLSILDQQYVRQSQAKSNTKAVAQAAITSIADKIAKNKLENRTLGIYENLYNYRYDNSGRAINMNPLVDFTSMIEGAVSNGTLSVDQNGKIIVNEQKIKRDEMGVISGSTETQRVTEVPAGYRGTGGRTKGNGGVVKSMKSC